MRSRILIICRVCNFLAYREFVTYIPVFLIVIVDLQKQESNIFSRRKYAIDLLDIGNLVKFFFYKRPSRNPPSTSEGTWNSNRKIH